LVVPNTRWRGSLGSAGRVLAGVTVVYGAAALVLAFVLDARTGPGVDRQGLTASTGSWLGAWGASAVVGATLLVRQPANRVGWLFSGLGVTLATWGLSESYAVYGLFGREGSLPASAGAAVVANSIFIVAFVLIALVCALTPDGAFLSRRWRMASRAMVAAASAWLVLRLISPEPLESPFEPVANPWAVGVDPRPVRLLAALATIVLIAAAVVSLSVRFQRARGEVRRQLLWLVVAAVVMSVLTAVAFAAAVTNNDVLLNAATMGLIVVVPVGAGLAVSRYHLYDIDRILSQAVTYVVVAGCLVAIYAAVVIVVASAVGQAAGRSPTATTAATLAAVVIARPVYESVRDGLDRRFHRRRYDAVRQVRAFVADPPPVRGVETVLREALGDHSLRVAYWDQASSRWVTEHGHTTDVVTGDAVIVERSGRPLAAVSSACDDDVTVRAVLDEAAPELDNARLRAALAVQLEEIRASRERIAEAQINERRRVERDLHDGAQQRLLGAAAQMQAALLNGTRERLTAALELGVSESRNAVAELRALANGLHPAVLEDGGLLAALEDLSSRLPVSLSSNGPQRRHQPLVEATMWFVACEAVSNAMKHAAARNVTMHLDDRETELRLVVQDDGRAGANPAGNGLRGLADRVEAAGGQLTITSAAGAGTRVEAALPCTS
jgi:signal transduction histidine kinase